MSKFSEYSDPLGEFYPPADLSDYYSPLYEDSYFTPPQDASVLFDAVAKDLTPQQLEAATVNGSILVLAGAGTGKTKTLTASVVHHIVIGLIQPSRILATTFTNKAAAEMATRIKTALNGEAYPRWIGTYHGLAARQLRETPEIAKLRPSFEILDADDSKLHMKRALKALHLASGEEEDAKSPIQKDLVKQATRHISTLKDNLVTPGRAADWVATKIAAANRDHVPIDGQGLQLAVEVYPVYQKLLREANAADFGDLLLWPTLAMQRDATYLERWASRFDCLFADEYQDVNTAQYCWLRALASSHKHVFLVGDDDQAIYGWRGSDITFIRRFSEDFPEAAHVRLEENFRSTGHILEAANAIIAEDKNRLGKTLYTQKGKGDPIEIINFRDDRSEATGIVMEIRRRNLKGTGYEDIAILYRNNAMSRVFEEALMRAHIPHVIVGDVGFYARKEIKDALALLRLLTFPDDPQSNDALRRVINEPKRGFGDKAMQDLEADAEFRNISLFNALETTVLPRGTKAAGCAFTAAIRKIASDQSHTLADQLHLVLQATGYRDMLKNSKAEGSEDRLENLQELISLAQTYHSARELLDHAALATSRPVEDETERVRLMTLHKAKGLEFPHVFLPAWEAGIFPSEQGNLSEERRLAYVAVTRGMFRVTISYCEYRRQYRQPSHFIGVIPDFHKVSGWLHEQDLKAHESDHHTYRRRHHFGR
jgi:DNA helicase-2/ATP-dependent DNA helicase PcrA